MSLSMYTASVPVFQHTLKAMSAFLSKAEAHAKANKFAPEALLQSRLFPNMFALTKQVQVACDFAKGTCMRLAGKEVPSFDDNESSFADLRARIDKTIALLGTIDAASIDGSETSEIHLNPGTPRERKFPGQTYLLHYSLPNFFFHVTTAYNILRHNGVDLGKKDFMGAL